LCQPSAAAYRETFPSALPRFVWNGRRWRCALANEVGRNAHKNRISAVNAASATQAPSGGSDGARPNALAQLYQVAASGKLGDSSLQFTSLLSNYRRRVIMRALAPQPHEVNDPQRKFDQRIVNALQVLAIEQRFQPN